MKISCVVLPFETVPRSTSTDQDEKPETPVEVLISDNTDLSVTRKPFHSDTDTFLLELEESFLGDDSLFDDTGEGDFFLSSLLTERKTTCNYSDCRTDSGTTMSENIFWKCKVNSKT